MNTKASTALTMAFQGKWRIVEMDLWDMDAINLVGSAFAEITGDEGEMRFIDVSAWLDIRYDTRDGMPIAEFSWEGVDAGDPRSGRGWFMQGTSERLVGHFFFHDGDDSGFACEPLVNRLG